MSPLYIALSGTNVTNPDPNPDPNPENDFDYPSDESIILHSVLNSPSKRWGWVVYRCTYNGENTWQRLKHHIINQNHKCIAESDAPQLIEYLEIVFFENQALFEGPSRADLRTHFKAWRAKDIAKLGLSDKPLVRGETQFEQFVQLDGRSLQSMAEEFEELGRLGDTGHVNLVLADWEPEDGLEDGGEGWYEEEVLELIDGCTQEDVGWMKVSGSGLLPCFFIYLGDPEDWHYKYVRPPEMYYIGYM